MKKKFFQFFVTKARIPSLFYMEVLKMEEFTDDFKIKMNRIFREYAGIKKVPHPEVDNLYERIRSGIIRIFFLIKYRIKKKLLKK